MNSVPLSPLLDRRLQQIARREHLTRDQLVSSMLREGVRAFDATSATRRPSKDVVFYRGPSLLTGDTILGVLTGLTWKTENPKIGRSVVQAWILRADRAPMDAVRQNLDDAICGDCALRGHDGRDRRCYVVPWLAPSNIWRAIGRQVYREVVWPEVRALAEGRSLRLGAYGDPAAIPFEVWHALIARARGWIGYTHQWRTCDPRFKAIVMASVDSPAEFAEAHAAGWRTFRILQRGDAPLPHLECRCPASAEAGHKTTCERCQLCRGTNRPARSIAIQAHGHNGVMAAFHRSRHAAEARV
jgi:hypothetical protein